MSLHRRPGGSQVNVGLLRHALLSGTALGSSPAFQADFTALTSLPSWLSFSRAGNAMVFDSTGKLTYAPNNILLQSNNFSDAAWNKSTCTIASGVSDPDGGTNASTLTATAANAIFYQQVGVDGNYVSSIWTRRRTGTGTVSLRTPDNSNTTPISVTGSWQRLFVSGAAAGGPVYTFAIVLATSGDAVDIYQALGERVTYETSPRTYNPTTTAAYYGPRFDHAWNGSAWVATGLLIEEQRTNALLSSNGFNSADWTFENGSLAQNVVGPDGASNSGWTWTANPASGIQIYQAVSLAAGSTYSIYIKEGSGAAWIGLQTYDGGRRTTYFQPSTGTVGSTVAIGSPTVTQSNAVLTPIGNGWYRASVTNNNNSTTFLVLWIADTDGGGDTISGSTKSILIANAGAELGQFATSHIPTTTAAVTRSADIVQLTGAALALMQGSAFTAIIETSNVVFGASIFQGNANNGFITAGWDTHTAQSYNGISSLLAPFPSGFWSDIQRCAYAGDAVGRSLVASGGTLSTDTGAFEGSTPTFISVGNNSSSAQIDGYVRSLALYSSRLSDADLQTKSVVGASF